MDDRLALVAGRLEDVASGVADEAELLTRNVRAVGEHARGIATLAAELDTVAAAIADKLADQIARLDRARAAAGTSEPAMAALAGSTRTIADMSRVIGEVAGRSRLLALNARIEAARVAATGHGFAVVASEMTGLAEQTRDTAVSIARRAAEVSEHVDEARRTIGASFRLLDREHAAVMTTADVVAEQRERAGQVAALTASTVERIDDAAAGIGRVSAAATVVRVLARQLRAAAGPAAAALRRPLQAVS